MNLIFLDQGDIVEIEGITIQGFGGAYSPDHERDQTHMVRGRDTRFFTNEDTYKNN